MRFRRVVPRGLPVIGLAFVLSALPEVALAGKKECVRAFDDGQRAQSDHALRKARDAFLACASAECPAVLRADCAKALDEVRAAIPTIVLAATDGEGHDVSGVRVTIDGAAVADALDGTAKEIEPGPHKIRFEPAAPWIAVDLEVVVKEGEKNRRIAASLAPPKKAEPKLAETRDVPEPPPPTRSAVGYVVPAGLTAVGVTGLVVAIASKVALDGRVDDLRATCAPTCSQDDRADASSMLVRTNVALAVGLSALGLAVASWVLFSPSSPRSQRPLAVLTW
jgi:hypothetical protein